MVFLVSATVITALCAKIFRHDLGGLFSGDASHLDFDAKQLVLQFQSVTSSPPFLLVQQVCTLLVAYRCSHGGQQLLHHLTTDFI